MSEPRAESFLVCLVTCPVEDAERFARRLVEARVAACVNRLPATSTYRWQGAVEQGAEVLLLIKTARERLDELERLLADEHPYEVPELVCLAPARVGRAYGAWWLAALGPDPGP